LLFAVVYNIVEWFP